MDEEDPPPPLPRGNFTQMHNFLSDSWVNLLFFLFSYTRRQCSTIFVSRPYEPKDGASRDPSRGDSRQNPGNVDNMSGQQQKPSRTNFRLGDISAISTLSTSRYKTLNCLNQCRSVFYPNVFSTRPPSRPGSSLSAHERLFGTRWSSKSCKSQTHP